MQRTRHVLQLGGSATASLSMCRWLAGAGHRASLLRWHAQASFAGASRHCVRSVWLGPLEEGVRSWMQRLHGLLGDGRFTDLWPLDEMAYELVCSGSWLVPKSVRVIGPTPASHDLAAGRHAAREQSKAAGFSVLPEDVLPRGGAIRPAALPCVVRPQRAAAVVEDEPARYAVGHIADPRVLANKLRDDLPRVGLFLQAPPRGERLDLIVASLDGEVRAVDAPATPSEIVSIHRLAARLRWTGLLRLEIYRDRGETILADLQADLPLVPGSSHAAGVALVTGILGPGLASAPMAALDPLPKAVHATQRLGRVLEKLTIRLRSLLWRAHGGVASSTPLRRTDSILFVCKGNINRSLVAEQVLRREGFTRVASAGLLGMSGRQPSRAAESYIESNLQLPAGPLRSSSVRRAMAGLGTVDIVVCFERRHVVELLQRHPNLRGRVHLLTTLAGQTSGSLDIDDPHGGSDETYRACFERIESLLRRAVAGNATEVFLATDAR